MKYLLPILFAFCFLSCQRHSDNWDTICDVENYIESRPDSALAVLEAIDVEALFSDEERAKYALYMSMALDKNYIDKTDFEVLQPAIDYYEDHGSATDKLRTFYYQGRIFQNIGDNAEAINSFIISLNFGDESDDNLTKARSLYAQGYIYSLLYDWDRLIRVSQQAADIYNKLDRNDLYVNCLTRIANAYSMKSELNKALEYLIQAKESLGSVGQNSKSNYYATYLSYMTLVEGVTKNDIDAIVAEYITEIQTEHIDWLSIANLYAHIGEVQLAYSFMQNCSIPRTPFERAKYYALFSDIYERQTMPLQALKAYKQYVGVSDSLDLVVYEQDAQFVEERHQLEMKALKERERKIQIIGLFVIISSIFVGIAIWISSRLRLSKMEKIVIAKEAERYKILYAQMEEERDNLNNLLHQSEELDSKAMNAVARRLELLNKFFTAYITDNSDIDRKASREMEELLKDKEKFMDSNRLAYAGSHPKFIKYLEDKGLTEWEINYCCLYALGLKGKEVGAYIKMRSHYNNSSEVREKLGISEHDTNLGIYIRKLVKSLSE
jgi:hypothetical protein